MTESLVTLRGLGRFAAGADNSTNKIELFNDFFGGTVQGATVTDNPAPSNLGDFLLYGQGSDEADAGALPVGGALGGVVRLTTTDEDNHCTIVGTYQAFQPSLMGPITMEARVQLNNLDTKEVFVGFSDVATATTNLEGAIGHGATTTLTLTASDILGFWLSAELTEDEMWHYIFNGGSTTGVTVSTTNQSGIDAVAGEWDVLRLELDTDGTARWYINDVLKKTLAGAFAPTTIFAAQVAVESKGTAVEELDADYLKVTATRDLTR